MWLTLQHLEVGHKICIISLGMILQYMHPFPFLNLNGVYWI